MRKRVDHEVRRRISQTIVALWVFLPVQTWAGEWTEKVKFSGFASGDVRFDIEDYRGLTPGDGYTFSMNRNDLDLRLEIAPADRVNVVIDTRLRYFGFNKADDLVTLPARDRVDPFDVRLDEAFVGVRGFVWKNMDLKVGRMAQQWGAADMFNPTDNLNARDFTDPLDYTAKVPNQMIEIDLYPADWLSLTAVWVPVFKPSQLPASAALGFAVERDRNGCLLRAPVPPLRDRDDAEALSDLFSATDPCALNFANTSVRTVYPDNGLGDSQAALRAKVKAGDLDLSLSYCYGRFTFPIAYDAYADVAPSATRPGTMDVTYAAEVMYPRMQVAGLDMSYSAPWLFDIGFVGEIALIFPEEVVFGLRVPAGGGRFAKGISTVNVPSDPFIKATAGVDYTFTRWLYMNAMYVRGFFDEFNDLYGIHNYVVLTAEMKFFEDELHLRLSGILNADDMSSVVYPQATWVVVPSVELVLGAFVFGGDTSPSDPLDYAAREKFGQKAAGRSVAFLKTKVTW
ncbi:MAG: hypothetical protein HY897_22155 [Deltaproteobacteria bacterium]|nr:hypothetical protein [Deltaproteobacteria bacterium]